MGHIFELYLQSPGPPLLYLHFLPDAFAAEVLDFVEVVCSEAACEGKNITLSSRKVSCQPICST